MGRIDATASEPIATLEYINKSLVQINETFFNATASIVQLQDAWPIFLTLAIIAVACLIIIKLVLPESRSGEPSPFEAKCETMGRTFIVTSVFLMLLLAAILVKDVILSTRAVPPASSIWAAIIIMALVFILLIYMGCGVDGTLDQGEMRRTIAGTFVLGFTMLIFFLAIYDVKNKDVVTAYLQMVGVIVGFYFGAKTALMGTSTGTSEGLAIEFVEVGEDKKTVILTIRNKGDNKLVVDKVYMTAKDFTKIFEMGITIDPKTSTKTGSLTLDKALDSGSVINIKVVANTGLADEREHKVP